MCRKKNILLKITSFFLAFSSTIVLLGANFLQAKSDTETVTSTEINERGQEVVSTVDVNMVCRVYIDSKLSQESKLDRNTQTIHTTIFDNSILNPQILQEKNVMGFRNIISQKNISEKRLSESVRASFNATVLRALYSEPVDNNGLDPAGMQGYEGYYYLGNYSLWGYTGYLYRSFSESFLEQVKRFTWTAQTTKSAIDAALVAAGFIGTPLIAVVLGLVSFISGVYLQYSESVKVDVWRVTHNYRVRVNGKQTYSTYRIRDYWWVKNERTGRGEYVFKRFYDGFSPANTEMIRAGIENYVNP